MKTTDVLLIVRRQKVAKGILLIITLFITMLLTLTLGALDASYYLYGVKAWAIGFWFFIFIFSSLWIAIWLYKFAEGWTKAGIADG